MRLTDDERYDQNLPYLLTFYPNRTLSDLKGEVQLAKSMRHTISRALQDVLALSPTLPPAHTTHVPSTMGRRRSSHGGSFVSIHIVRSQDDRIMRRLLQLSRNGALHGQQDRLSALVRELRWLADTLPGADDLVYDAVREHSADHPDAPQPTLASAHAAAGTASELAHLLQIVAKHQQRHTHILTELLGGDWCKHEDPLGRYIGAERRIELFWPEIALCAALCHVSIEQLAIKVLTHEMAHALTDAGLDTTQKTWSFRAFAGSHHFVLEGLAQFFTLEALQRSTHPALQRAVAAFHALLPHQSIAYRAWRRWLPGHDARGELIRLSLLAFRMQDRPIPLQDFLQTLEKGKALHLSENADPNALAQALVNGAPSRISPTHSNAEALAHASP